MEKHIITIGREFGSGGHEVGFRLAKRLNIPFYDKELLKLTAKNSRFSETFLSQMDEQRPSFLNVGSSGLISGSPIAATAEGMMNQFYHLSPNDQIFLEQSKTMHELAKAGSCVIVGRCADYILKQEKSINFFVYAHLQDRINRKLALDENHSLTEEQMEKLVLSTDKTRGKFYEYYTHERWGVAKNYHLCIDTSAVGIDGAVELMILFIEEFGKKNILPDKNH